MLIFHSSLLIPVPDFSGYTVTSSEDCASLLSPQFWALVASNGLTVATSLCTARQLWAAELLCCPHDSDRLFSFSPPVLFSLASSKMNIFKSRAALRFWEWLHLLYPRFTWVASLSSATHHSAFSRTLSPISFLSFLSLSGYDVSTLQSGMWTHVFNLSP